MRLLRLLVCRPMRLPGQRYLPQILRLCFWNAVVPAAWPLAGRFHRTSPGNAHLLRLGNSRWCAGPCGDRGKGGEWNGLYCGGQFQGYVSAEEIFSGEWCDFRVWSACDQQLKAAYSRLQQKHICMLDVSRYDRLLKNV